MRIANLSYAGFLFALSSMFMIPASFADEPMQKPLFLTSKVRPIMMLNMSRDHELFFKLYDDYADITDSNGLQTDGKPDTTYINNYSYYGYFDSNKCYDYEGEVFVPKEATGDHYCQNDLWSGNFLNWVSMTRLDAIRKILYGGYRITDTADRTILERAGLPNDAHSFAKYYNGSDIDKLTPFSNNAEGVTFCNTSLLSNRYQFIQNDSGKPVIRVVSGNYSLWAANERFQCLTKEDTFDHRRRRVLDSNGGNGLNDNNPSASGIPAASDSPVSSTDYTVRIQVCDPDLIDIKNDEQCRSYEHNNQTTYKPAGLLQEYGESESIHFGLMTGTWGKSKDGGVLRKNVSSFMDEVNANGTFKAAPTKGGIVNTLNQFSIYGYNWGGGTYNNDGGGAECSWGISSFSNGQCHNWGNPQAEIYLESLRYLAGKQPNDDFYTNDKTFLSGLSDVPDWEDPIQTGENSNYCAPLNILQFNTSSSSFDSDSLTQANTIFSVNIDDFTKKIGSAEGIDAQDDKRFFIGESGRNSSGTCTAKTINNLADARGSCPDAPSLEGGYDMAGLAYAARQVGIGNDREHVKTFGVALAPALPVIEVPIPGAVTAADGKAPKVSIVPSCFNNDTNRNCSIVDFKIVEYSHTDTISTGTAYVNWEDSKWGGDFDMDMWGTIKYEVTNDKAKITTDVIGESTPFPLGFGYVISGTTQDGLHIHSGVDNFSNNDNSGVPSCTRCSGGNDPTSHTYTIGNSDAEFLKPALYYAAKWGGYENDDMTEEEIANRIPENYYYAIEPRELKESLSAAFDKVSKSQGSSSAAAANSARLTSESLVYQARFNTESWSGQVVAYPIKMDGSINMNATPKWDTNNTLTRNSVRNIYTYDGNRIRGNEIERETVKLSDASWNQNDLPTLMSELGQESDSSLAKKRFDWLLGEDDDLLRSRDYILGDIVNSDPAYSGTSTKAFNKLPEAYGANNYLTFVANKKQNTQALFVGANDGMLHAFNADTGEEIFAYIPRGAYPKLKGLMDIDFDHQFIVDGSVYVGDAYIKIDEFTKAWRTIVVGSLGYGGRGVFALDVTETLKDTTKAPTVIFDFTAMDNDSPIKDEIGFILNKPVIAPLIDGTWRVVFGNGVNSANGSSALIAIDLDDPLDGVAIIDTEARIAGTNDNGLSGASLLPNSYGVTTYVYGGDIQGNMWKFDLSDADNRNWDIPYESDDTPKPLIRVVDDENNPQPISTTPTLGYNYLRRTGVNQNDYAIMVYFVTGKYYTSDDIQSEDTQSIYAIADVGSAYEFASNNRTRDFHQKTISEQTSTKRAIANDKNVNWLVKNGWFLDLESPDGATLGERGLSKMLLIYNRLIFATFTPSASQCDFGGNGWLMELNAVNGVYNDDIVILEEDGNSFLDSAILSDLSPVSSKEELFILASLLGSGEDEPTLTSFSGSGLSGTRGRISWQELTD